MRLAFYLFIVFFMTFQLVSSSRNCSAGCETCTNATTCTQCKELFALNARKAACFKCPPGCYNCTFTSGELSCLRCLEGYQQTTDGICFKCNPICDTCEDFPKNCLTCREGDVIVNKGSFNTCEPNADCLASRCAQCSVQSEHICLQCKAGFFNFKGYCILCMFPYKACMYPFDIIYVQEIVPFIQGLRAGAGTRRMLQTVEPLNILTDNLTDVNVEDMEYYILGRHLYQILVDNDIIDDPLERTLIAQNIVNKQREIFMSPLSLRKRILTADFNAETGLKITQDRLFDDIQLRFKRQTIGLSCRNGFKFNTATGKCDPCPRGCIDCDDSRCYDCFRGANLTSDNSGCQLCASPCKTCEAGNSSSCLTCEPPFKLNDNNECVKCARECLTCDPGSPDVCTKCKYPSSLVPRTDGSCFRCSDFKCLRCDQTNNSICYECAERTNLINNQCRLCPRGCTKCDIQDTPATCYSCRKGMVLINNTCERCRKGCLECSVNDKSICLIAFDGLYVNQSGVAKRCPEICETCMNESSCIEYKKGKVDFGGQVLDCRKGCDICNPLEPQNCINCQRKGFFQDGDQCKRCSKGCKFCSDESTCTQCRNRFALSGSSCLKCDRRCLTCSPTNQSECLSCKRGLVLESQTCVPKCEKGCLICRPSEPQVCLECEEGKTLRYNGKCIKCMSTCNGDCDPKNVTRCLSCTDGFQLVDNVCERCPPGCEECVDGHCQVCRPNFKLVEINSKFVCQKICKFPCSECIGNRCTGCAPKFKLTGGKCLPDISCNPKCDFCPSGTFKDNVTCIRCSQNCTSCDDTQCFECLDGFYNDNGVCKPCEGNCLLCEDADTCLECRDGFLLQVDAENDGAKSFGGECVRCASNCQTCVDSVEFCLSCGADMSLNSTICIGRFLVKFEFVIDYAFSEFLQNYKLQELITAISDLLEIDSDEIIISELKEGSSSVSGSVSSDQETADSTSESLAAGTDSLGFSIISSSVDVYYDGQKYVPEETVTSDIELGIIIGASIGGVVLIAIIIIIVYKYKKHQQNMISIGQDSPTKRSSSINKKDETFYEVKVQNYE